MTRILGSNPVVHVALAAALAAAAQAQAQQVVPERSSIGFVIKQMGVPVEGRFSRFDARIAFDPKKPEAGSVSFSIPLAGAEIGDAATTKELAKPEWFDTARQPTASFVSTAIKAQGPGRYEVAGKLTIKGVTRQVLVPVTIAAAGGAATASGQFALQRVNFKIGEGDWSDTSIVADEVQVKFKLALEGLAAP